MKGILAKILTCIISFHLVCAPVAEAKSKNTKVNILMIATAVAAPLVLIQCKKKISTWIFLGTAAYFLATELSGSKKQKDDSGKILDKYKGKGASEKQIEALESAAKGTERAAKEADDRSKRFKMVGMGFGAAAAAALVEAFLATKGTAPKKKPPCILPDKETGDCTKGSCGGGGVDIPSIGGTFSSSDTEENEVDTNNALSWGGVKSFFSKAWNSIKKAIDNGYIRAAIFGALAGLAFMASSGTKKDAEKLGKRAKHYRDLAAKMRRRLGLEKGLSQGQLQYIPPVSKQASAPEKSKPVATGNQEGSCVVGAPGQYPQEDPTCACKKNNSCKKAELPKVNYPQFTGVSSDLNEVGALLKGDADKVYSGDLSETGNISDAKLSKLAAKVDNVRKRLWGLAENEFKKRGKKMNGALLEEAYGARLKRAINSDFNKMSAADKGRLAAISPAFLNGTVTPKESDVKKVMTSPQTKNELVGGGSMARSGSKALGGIEFLGAEETVEEVIEEGPGKEESYTSDKDIKDKAVHKGSDRSIWKIISIRYLKSFF